ncbi:hypothetical protein BJV78DRAFT_888948 [Lactifluus subvellereus]|nr:hypothetical protein BJV78DRAFT_888948 [Lactifluus subvellereus]
MNLREVTIIILYSTVHRFRKQPICRIRTWQARFRNRVLICQGLLSTPSKRLLFLICTHAPRFEARSTVNLSLSKHNIQYDKHSTTQTLESRCSAQRHCSLTALSSLQRRAELEIIFFRRPRRHFLLIIGPKNTFYPFRAQDRATWSHLLSSPASPSSFPGGLPLACYSSCSALSPLSGYPRRLPTPPPCTTVWKAHVPIVVLPALCVYAITLYGRTAQLKLSVNCK